MTDKQNGWGGKRPGAGRKPDGAESPARSKTRDPLQFLLDTMQGLIEPTKIQVAAAIAAVQYIHAKKGKQTEEDARRERSDKANTGKFAAKPPPPKLLKFEPKAPPSDA
jgi:phage terminase small subunit